MAQKTDTKEPAALALAHIEEAFRLAPHNAEALVNARIMAGAHAA